MSIIENGTGGLPDLAPVRVRELIAGVGRTDVLTWRGTPDAINAKYETLAAEADMAASNIAQLTATIAEGRASLVARYGREGGGGSGYPADITIVEELYAVDVVRDIWAAPYFTTDAVTLLSDDECAWVLLAVNEKWSEADITENANASWKEWGSWTAGMKQLRYHMLHGQESYYETAFVFRRNLYGVRTSAMGLSFANINRVVSAPVPTTALSSLIDTLPSGEWLYKPPQVETLSKGRVRGSLEWHWAVKWSKVYGGTFGL